MLFDRSQNSESSLVSLVVVIVDIVFDHGYKLLAAVEALTIISLSLQDPPKPFHRTIVYTVSHSGHTLLHMVFLKPCRELLACVLISSVGLMPNSA